MSSQARSRADRRKQETRARILEAAVDLFGEVGFEATKVADVCERADVARQTFFNHFPTKGDLLEEIYREGVGFVSALFDSAYEGGATMRERIALFFTGLVGAAVDVGPSSRDLVRRILHSDPNPERARRFAELFRAFVMRGVEAGDVTRTHAPEVLAELVQGALGSLFTDWGLREGLDPRRRAEELAALVADALELRPDERQPGRMRGTPSRAT
jgi:AcrR family transcriptional regulator